MVEDNSFANLQKIELKVQFRCFKTLEDRKKKKDKKYKGVLFVVNSPGGSVAPSVELAYAIKRVKRD